MAGMVIGAASLLAVVLAVAAWRIGSVAPWRDLGRIARATGSVAECVAFVRFCARR